jgi:hypothetical protein
VKTRRVVGYVAVAFACATGCSGSPVPSIHASRTKDGGAKDGGRELNMPDARTGDEEDGASGGSEGGGADGTTNGAPGSSSSQYCCVGGAYYVCPSAMAIAQCTSACTRDPSKDATCTAFDAGSGGGSPPAPLTNACGGPYLGFPCDTGGGCIGGTHCTASACYPNDVGNPCTYGTDCGDGNHCTAGCCASPATGSACNAFWDCKSGTCTNNVCQ